MEIISFLRFSHGSPVICSRFGLNKNITLKPVIPSESGAQQQSGQHCQLHKLKPLQWIHQPCSGADPDLSTRWCFLRRGAGAAHAPGVESSVLSMTSVLYYNYDRGKSTFMSIASSELQLELTDSLMTPFLYLLSCTCTLFSSYTHVSVQYELWFHSTNTALENIVVMRFVLFWYGDDLPA